MSVGPVRPMPRFADFVAAAEARRAAGSAPPPAFRVVATQPARAQPPADFPVSNDLARRAGPGAGYADILGLAENLSLPDLPPGSSALAAANRALGDLAASYGRTPAEFARDAPIAPREKLPSQNSAHAESALKATVVAHDEARGLVTLDVHVARAGENVWEIAVFDQSASSAGGFPYAAPPLVASGAIFDPVAAELVVAASLANTFSPRRGRRATPLATGEPMRVAAALIALALVLGLAFRGYPLAAMILAIAAIHALRQLQR